MPGTTTLVWSAIDPVLVGSAYEACFTEAPRDDGATGTQLVWCAATVEFVRRHPDVTAAVDVHHPDGCTDLVIDVDDQGRLGYASLECLDLDRGLVGRPIAEVLPVLVDRIGALLR